jgi:hypothetical protein
VTAPESPDDRHEPEPPHQPELPRWARPAAASPELSDARMVAYFGGKWEKSYKRKLAPFFEDPSFVPTWNWSAALTSFFTPSIWFLYRKLYLPFALFFFVPSFVLRYLTGSTAPATLSEIAKPENESFRVMALAVQISVALAAGGTANWFLFRRARAANRFVSMQALPEREGLSLMQRMGGVNRMGTVIFLALMVMITLAQLGG